MTAIDAIRLIMEQEKYTLAELGEYAELGSRANVFKTLSCKDLKVGTFVKMLEAMGYQLVAQGENGDDILIDGE